jgi:dynein light chain roadblock-type
MEEADLRLKKTSASSSLAELEETMARLSSYKGVKAVMILHRRTGNIIQSTWSDEHKVQHAALLQQLTSTSTMLTSSLDNDELSFLRIRSKQHEILVAPDKEYVLVVLQNAMLVE